MDAKLILEEFVDYLAPKLDTYEAAIYLYILRHGRLQGKEEITIGFKSARRDFSFGIGEKGKPMSESTCREKLQSLQSKGYVRVLGVERSGTRVAVNLPSEIPGLVPPEETAIALSLEEMDFFTIPVNRELIVQRDGHQCFYCLRTLDASNYVIEHVVSRPNGSNNYRNVVAACLTCNNRKGPLSAEDFLRSLYREAYLSAEDLSNRFAALELLRNGHLKPSLPVVKSHA